MPETIVLTQSDIAELLSMDACIDVVEQAFRLHAQGKVAPPGVLGTHVTGGGFHVKTAALEANDGYYVAKVNANFPANRERFGLPTIQGVVALFHTDSGHLLALLDSIEITSVRTAAATAVAAKYLAKATASVVTICGCGEQGRSHLRALARVIPVQKVYAVDVDSSRAERYAQEMGVELGLTVQPERDLSRAAGRSDVCVTCTTSKRPLLDRGDVAPGTFVAAVGADNPEKHEIDPTLMAGATVVCDLVEQCAHIGDLHHAIAAGAMTAADVYAELGEIVAGMKPGRRSEEEVIVFDSTGTALQDVAAAAMVYQQALRAGRGLSVTLGA